MSRSLKPVRAALSLNLQHKLGGSFGAADKPKMLPVPVVYVKSSITMNNAFHCKLICKVTSLKRHMWIKPYSKFKE